MLAFELLLILFAREPACHFLLQFRVVGSGSLVPLQTLRSGQCGCTCFFLPLTAALLWLAARVPALTSPIAVDCDLELLAK